MHVAAVYYFLFSYVKYCRGKIKLRCFSTSYSLNLSFPVFTRGISSHLSDYAIIPLNGHRTRIFSTVDGSVSWHALWKYQRTSLILCTLAVLMVNSFFVCTDVFATTTSVSSILFTFEEISLKKTKSYFYSYSQLWKKEVPLCILCGIIMLCANRGNQHERHQTMWMLHRQ